MPYRDARRALPVLTVKVPCRVPWEDMLGDGAVRFCLSCRKNVHDLTAMTEPEIDAIMQRKDRTCVRFYARPDGRVLESKCSAGRETPRLAKALIISASAALFCAATTAFIADWPRLAPDEDLELSRDGFTTRALQPDLPYELVMGERDER